MKVKLNIRQRINHKVYMEHPATITMLKIKDIFIKHSIEKKRKQPTNKVHFVTKCIFFVCIEKEIKTKLMQLNIPILTLNHLKCSIQQRSSFKSVSVFIRN